MSEVIADIKRALGDADSLVNRLGEALRSPSYASYYLKEASRYARQADEAIDRAIQAEQRGSDSTVQQVQHEGHEASTLDRVSSTGHESGGAESDTERVDEEGYKGIVRKSVIS